MKPRRGSTARWGTGWERRRPVGRLVPLALLVFGGGARCIATPAPAVVGEDGLTTATAAAASGAADIEARVEAIRRWMIGAEGTASDSPPTDYWMAYLAIGESAAPEARERALQALLDQPLPDLLRQVILRDIASDLRYQSRQAQFIRRYGVQAAWFNRLVYSASRALQGNVQAVGQVLVDALFDLFGRTQMTPAERRIYRLERALEAAGRSPTLKTEELERLRRKLERAQAAGDLERARWALRQGDAVQAEFYARAALIRRPLWDKADAVGRAAAVEIARRRRAAAASSQVGYPDRDPPMVESPPELLRAVLATPRGPLRSVLETSGGAPGSGVSASGLVAAQDAGTSPVLRSTEIYLASVLASAGEAEGSAIMELRRWAEAIGRRPELRTPETVWLRALLLNPAFNPDLRLARAQASRRANLARFIFLGPETAQERLYATSSRAAQAWNAVASLGVFYVFEVIYRTGVALFSPPPPAEDVLDAAAVFLDAAPLHAESRWLADWLARQHVAAGRHDQARRLLERYGRLDLARAQEINRAEARGLIALAEGLAVGEPLRRRLLDRVQVLAPGTGLARRAERLIEQRPQPTPPIVVHAAWASLEAWLGQPPPAGLPALEEWFDGDAANGEVADPGFTIEAEDADAREITLSYPLRIGTERRIVEERLTLTRLPEPLARYLRHAVAAQGRAERELSRLGRPRIPYEIKGGLGPGGVDFYPQLLPIESDPAALRLYRD